MPRDDHAIHALLSGQSKGVRATALRGVLSVAEPVYARVIGLRNKLYDRNLLRVVTLGRPTISVGNLTTGGTGKTPVVAWLARALFDAGGRPGVLLRGYKSKNGSSDEADELRDRLGPVVPIQVDGDRVRGAKALLGHWPEVDVLLLDDAFQHRRAGRNVDLVVVDATNPFGFDHVLPRGLLREAVEPALARASAIILTKIDQVDAPVLQNIIDRLHRIRPALPVFQTRHRIARVRLSDGGWQPPGWLSGRRAGAFCGIGNPTSFRTLLERAGVDLVFWETFADHHAYTPSDVERLKRQSIQHGIDTVLTTAKDAARLRPPGVRPTRMNVVELALEFEADHAARLLQFIHELIPTRK